MASLTTIRAGIAANLRAITGLQVSTWALANPTPPCIEIVPGPIVYDEAFNDGAHTINITVRVFVGMVSEIGAQKLLDQFLASTGAKSVKAAIESDLTLGGACSDAHVTGCSGYRTYGADARALGAEWAVSVLA